MTNEELLKIIEQARKDKITRLDLSHLEILNIENNPLPMPPEILTRYNHPADIINYYF